MDWLHNVVTLNLKVVPKLNCWITADCAGHKDMEQCEQLITTSKTAQKSTKTVLTPSFNNSQNSRIFRANLFLLIRTHSRCLNTPDVKLFAELSIYHFNFYCWKIQLQPSKLSKLLSSKFFECTQHKHLQRQLTTSFIFRQKRQAPYMIFPEILVIVDYDGYR